MPRKEASVRVAVTKKLNEYLDHGLVWFSVPATPYSRRGVPDILGLWGGQAFAIELKSSTGETTPLQRLFAERWTEAGGWYAVVRGSDDLRQLLDRFEEKWGSLD